MKNFLQLNKSQNVAVKVHYILIEVPINLRKVVIFIFIWKTVLNYL